MEMLNRAIEDAADFKAFREALTKRNDLVIEAKERSGENRKERRARERAERKAAQKTKARA